MNNPVALGVARCSGLTDLSRVERSIVYFYGMVQR